MKNIFKVLILLVTVGCSDRDTGESTPVLFGTEILSTKNAHESINQIMNGGQTVYLTRANREYSMSTVMISELKSGVYSTPKPVSFSGTFYDAGLSLSNKNRLAIFTSKRPTEDSLISDDWNIWQSVLSKDGDWSKPFLLPDPINTNSSECCLIMNKSGDAYFASNREGSWDIFSTKYKDGRWSSPEKVTLSSEYGEWPGYINDDNNLLLFSSIRKIGKGGDDIYYSKRKDEHWGEAVILDTVINTSSYEDSPYLGGDGYLYYSSADSSGFSSGVSNIYKIKWSALDIE